MKATKDKETKECTNDHMTAQCGHGKQGMCDYCLIAFGEHAEKPGVSSHMIRETKEKYTCAQCAGAGKDTLASRQEARADAVAERIAQKLFEGRKGHGQAPVIVERHLRRSQIKHIVKLAYEHGVQDGVRDSRGPG